MATVKRRGSAWQATYRAPDGRERTRTYAKKVDAQRWVDTAEADKARGEWIDPKAARVTFGDYARTWAAGQVWRPTTAETTLRRLNLHVLPYLGDAPMSSLRPSQLQAWVKGRSEVLAPSTVALCVQTVRSVLKAAVADRLVATNPADGVRLPKVEREKVVPLEREQVEALREAVPDRYKAAIIVAAGSGLRLAELFGLTVDRVDFLRKNITVDRQMVSGVKGQKPSLGPPKTDTSHRVVPVPDVVVETLSAHLAAHPARQDRLVFTTDSGTPVTRMLAGRIWRAGAWLAELPEWANGWHQLRHFYASLLIRAGESVKVVSVRLGHTNAAMTLNVYSHLWPADDDRTRDAVQSVLGNPGDWRGHSADFGIQKGL